MNNPAQEETGSGVMLFGSTDHDIAESTKTGHLFEAVSFRSRGIVLVSTDKGAFPFDNVSNQLEQELRNDVLERPVMREVTVRAPDVYAEEPGDGETLIGTMNRYDGTAFDPTRENVGSIEIVHRYQDSGNMVLTDQNPSGRVYDFQAHGATLLNRLLNTQDPSAGTPAERKDLLDNILVELKAVWGDSVEVDFESGSFEPVGEGVNAQKCAHFKERVRQAITGGPAPNESASEEGLPEL